MEYRHERSLLWFGGSTAPLFLRAEIPRETRDFGSRCRIPADWSSFRLQHLMHHSHLLSMQSCISLAVWRYWLWSSERVTSDCDDCPLPNKYLPLARSLKRGISRIDVNKSMWYAQIHHCQTYSFFNNAMLSNAYRSYFIWWKYDRQGQADWSELPRIDERRSCCCDKRHA